MVEIKNLSAGYNGQPVIRIPSLSFGEGEITSIIGENGSGKSTLLKAITREIPAKGKIKFDGIKQDQIGYISQKSKIEEKFPAAVHEIVASGSLNAPSFGLFYNRKIKSKTLEALRTLKIEKLAKRSFSELSGGQQQRVAIARSLISKPSIILADEPTGNLDSRSSHIIMEELRDIHAQGNTIIMVTHNPSLTTYATRVINMLDGEIDTDIKTVDDSELPRPGSPERISVRILSKKRPVELEVDSKTKVVVSGEHVTIGDSNSIDAVTKPKPKKKLAKKPRKKIKPEKKES